MNAVVIESLRKQFGAQLVLPSFDLQIAEGEFVVLLGPSGCGKTTVLRCLAGLERPDGGRISIGGDVVEDAGRRLSMPIQKRDLGFVFQHYALWPHMTVHENIAYPLKMKGVGRSERSRKIDGMFNLQEGTALQAIRENSRGIVVRGARVLATLGPISDEIAVYSPRLGQYSEGHSPFALAFSISGGASSAAPVGRWRSRAYRMSPRTRFRGRSSCRRSPCTSRARVASTASSVSAR